MAFGADTGPGESVVAANYPVSDPVPGEISYTSHLYSIQIRQTAPVNWVCDAQRSTSTHVHRGEWQWQRI